MSTVGYGPVRSITVWYGTLRSASGTVRYATEYVKKSMRVQYLLLGSYLDKTTIKKCEDEKRKVYNTFSIEISDLTAEQKQIVGFIFNFLLDEEIME